MIYMYIKYTLGHQLWKCHYLMYVYCDIVSRHAGAKPLFSYTYMFSDRLQYCISFSVLSST